MKQRATANPGNSWADAFQSSPWELSAPETHLLRTGLDTPPSEVLKTAFRELLARGALAISQIELRSVSGTEKRFVVDGGPNRRQVRRPLFDLIELYDAMPARRVDQAKAPPVPLVEYIAVVTKHFGGSKGYRDRVVTALIDRGLYQRQRKGIGPFGRERVALTPAGERTQKELEQRLEIATQMPEWARGMAFAGLLGSAVLVVAEAFPELQRLQSRLGGALVPSDKSGNGTEAAEAEFELPESFRLLGAKPDAEPPVAALPANATGSPFAAPPPQIDMGAFSFDLDVASFDGLDSAMTAIDAALQAVEDR